MKKEYLNNLLSAMNTEFSNLKIYNSNLNAKINQMIEKEKYESENTDNLYKINDGSGLNEFIRLTYEKSELIIYMNDLLQKMQQLKTAIDNETEVDLNDEKYVTSAKHFIDENNQFNYEKSNYEDVKNTADFNISKNINQLGKYNKVLNYYEIFDEFVDYKDNTIDVQGIYSSIENEDYSSEELKEIKEAVVYIANAMARKRNSANINLSNQENIVYNEKLTENDMHK